MVEKCEQCGNENAPDCAEEHVVKYGHDFVYTKPRECEDCKSNAKNPDVKYYEQGTKFFYVSKTKNEDDEGLSYEDDEFQPNDNDSGYFCGSCERELTKEEVYRILGIESD